MLATFSELIYFAEFGGLQCSLLSAYLFYYYAYLSGLEGHWHCIIIPMGNLSLGWVFVGFLAYYLKLMSYFFATGCEPEVSTNIYPSSFISS